MGVRMDIFLSSLTAVSFAITGANALAETCPISAGEIVTTEKASTLFAKISSSVLEKDEFETTAQFEARKDCR